MPDLIQIKRTTDENPGRERTSTPLLQPSGVSEAKLFNSKCALPFSSLLSLPLSLMPPGFAAAASRVSLQIVFIPHNTSLSLSPSHTLPFAEAAFFARLGKGELI
jgi:hypothetical protein